MTKSLHFGLLPRIIAAMVLGAVAGLITPPWAARLLSTLCSLFSSYLGFLIPLIIVGFVTPAIADIGRNAGRMLFLTVALSYVATTLAGMMSYACGEMLFPSLITDSLPAAAAEGAGVKPYFTLDLQPLCGVMTALVSAFMLGLCMARIETPVSRGLAGEMRGIVQEVIVRSVIPLLPFYIFGIFHNMTVEGQVAVVVSAFFKVIIVIFALHIAVLLTWYCVAALFGRKNPLKMLKTMLPAYFTALGTQSSAATIPVTLRQAVKMGVSPDVAGFVIPLCATIHMSGSMLKITACALAVMIMDGMPYDFMLFLGFITMLAVTMVAAPGIPGGAIIAALGVLQSILGFSETQCALMIALYIAMDGFGTACNVTGDGAVAVIVDKVAGKTEKAEEASEAVSSDASL